MIIDFTVENFRSIKEPVTLSMVAQSRATSRSSIRAGVKPDDEIAKPYAIGNRGVDVLPAVGIFGPNASGKSNVIRALTDLLRWMASGSAWRISSQTIVPFRLDEVSEGGPTNFEIRIAIDHIVYCYAISWRTNRVVSEVLERILPEPKGKRLLFNRRWNGKAYIWKNGKDFTGSHTLLQNTLQSHEPYISTLALRVNTPVAMPLLIWLKEFAIARVYSLRYYFSSDEDDTDWALQATLANKNLLDRVTQVLRQFDSGISEISIEPLDSNPNAVSGHLMHFARHEVGNRIIEWPFYEESTGTQKLFLLVCKVIRSFDTGTPMLIDDFGSSLHPDITHTIARMFQDEKLNPKRAQLIFNSHDYTLMHGNLLRRDQIWFTQKRKDGSTELYPLTDFQPRNDLAIDKAYINGRFGAVPILPADEDLLPAEELVG